MRKKDLKATVETLTQDKEVSDRLYEVIVRENEGLARSNETLKARVAELEAEKNQTQVPEEKPAPTRAPAKRAASKAKVTTPRAKTS